MKTLFSGVINRISRDMTNKVEKSVNKVATNKTKGFPFRSLKVTNQREVGRRELVLDM